MSAADTRSKALHRLTALQVDRAAPQGGKAVKLHDGGGLSLKITKAGTKSWMLRYTVKGQKTREMGLGDASAGRVSLRQARGLAAKARALVQSGVDPIDAAKSEVAKKQAEQAAVEALKNIKPLGAYLDAWVTKEFGKPPYKLHVTANVINPLRKYAAGLLAKPLAEITLHEAALVLGPLRKTKAPTEKKVRINLRRLFSFAKVTEGFAGSNPFALEDLRVLLPPQNHKVLHHPALPWRELPEFFQQLRSREPNSPAVLASEFIILAAARYGEVQFAEWSEIDLKRRLWIVPADRMKMGKEHAVILTDRMVEILSVARALPKVVQGTNYVFPSASKLGCLSENACLNLLDRLGVGRKDHSNRADGKNITVHGFRSTFRDWAGGSMADFPRELAEEALAHAVGGVEAAYRREQAVERRRAMMEAYDAFCTGQIHTGDNVVPLRGAN